MSSLLVGLLVAATPLKLAAPALGRLNVSEEEAAYYLDALSERLAGEGLQVTTSAEIASLLGVERQKALLGCNEAAASCIVELANALGVDGILKGSIGRFGERYELTLKVLRNDASVSARFNSSVEGQGKLSSLWAEAAESLRAQLLGSKPPRSRPWLALAPAVVGLLSLGPGIALWAVSNGKVSALEARDAMTVGSDPIGFAAAARNERVGGVALICIGSALLVAGVAWFLLGGGG